MHGVHGDVADVDPAAPAEGAHAAPRQLGEDHLPPAPERGPAEPIDTRRVYVAGRYLDVPVHARRDLGRDADVPGPAIIEQEDCTVWVLPGWNAAVDRTGSLLVQRRVPSPRTGRRG